MHFLEQDFFLFQRLPDLVVNGLAFRNVVRDAAEFLGPFVVLDGVDKQLVPNQFPYLVDEGQLKLLLNTLCSPYEQLELSAVKFLRNHFLEQLENGCSNDGVEPKLFREDVDQVLVHGGDLEVLVNGEHQEVARGIENRFQLS